MCARSALDTIYETGGPANYPTGKAGVTHSQIGWLAPRWK
jgi:hypothetical protein